VVINPWRGKSPREDRVEPAASADRRQRILAELETRETGDGVRQASPPDSDRANVRRGKLIERSANAAEGEAFEGRNPKSVTI
jgi:hypothetical protein